MVICAVVINKLGNICVGVYWNDDCFFTPSLPLRPQSSGKWFLFFPFRTEGLENSRST
jgi:hypothetical protein